MMTLGFLLMHGSMESEVLNTYVDKVTGMRMRGMVWQRGCPRPN